MRNPFRWLMIMVLSLVLASVLTGCGDDEDDGMPKTLEAAKERIRFLEAEIVRLSSGLKGIEDKTKAEHGDLRLLVSQLRQENDDLARTIKLGESIGLAARSNAGVSFYISIAVNFLAFLVIFVMQLRHRRLLDECNHYITHRLHG